MPSVCENGNIVGDSENCISQMLFLSESNVINCFCAVVITKTNSKPPNIFENWTFWLGDFFEIARLCAKLNYVYHRWKSARRVTQYSASKGSVRTHQSSDLDGWIVRDRPFTLKVPSWQSFPIFFPNWAVDYHSLGQRHRFSSNELCTSLPALHHSCDIIRGRNTFEILI